MEEEIQKLSQNRDNLRVQLDKSTEQCSSVSPAVMDVSS